MAKYRKKPVVIDAWKFNTLPDYIDIVEEYNKAPSSTLSAEELFSYKTPIMLIHTLEGTMAANPGDYIIRGVKGEYYFCKPDIFEATYESVLEKVVKK